DRGFRRVDHQDAALRRGVDVHVVDSHPGAADHPEPVGSFEQFCRDAGRAAHDERVVGGDPLVEVGVEIHVDVKTLPQQLHTGLGNPLTYEHARTLIRHTVTPCSYASRADAAATPGSTATPSSVHASSSPSRAATTSSSPTWPMWPIRTIFPRSGPWPPAIVIPERSRSVRTTAVPSTPSGTPIAVTTTDRSSSGEKSSSPIAFTPARQARPSRRALPHAASRPSASRRSSAASSPRTSETAGVKDRKSVV